MSAHKTLTTAKTFKRASLLVCASLVSACSTTFVADNDAITAIDDSSGYRRFDQSRLTESGDTTILLAFSGGGTRAAALSYGVMQELRDTRISVDGESIRVLDEVDTISSVSGGSFTSAYYGVFGEKLFESFEDDFLRQEVQSHLIKSLFNPVNWYKGLFKGLDRKEITIDYYEEKVFRGTTFSDMNKDGPFIEINATDLGTGLRFTFNQERFDLICADLDTFSVARAVTASSSVPVAFPTVVLENHADQCDIEGSTAWNMLENVEIEGAAQKHLVDGLKSYRDVDKRKYIHLVDGGISDNLGLRATIDRLESVQYMRSSMFSEKAPKNILVVLVNADVDPEVTIESESENPSVGVTMGALTSAQMELYSEETRDRVRKDVADFNRRATDNGIDSTMYFSEVSFDSIRNDQLKKLLNSMPTSLELTDEQVDQLIVAGRILLRKEPSFQKFLGNNDGRLQEGAMGEREICKYLPLKECVR